MSFTSTTATANRLHALVMFPLRLAVLVSLCTAAGCAWWSTQRLAPPLAVYELGLPDSPSPNQIAISPDGQYVVGWLRSGVGNVLWMRPLASLSGGPIEGSLTPRNPSIGFPFWSPDGQRITFLADGYLEVLDRNGGVRSVLVSAPAPLGGTWSSDDVILYAPTGDGPIYRIAADSATPTPVTRLDRSREETSHRHPFFLPDGRNFIYHARNNRDDYSGIWLASLDSDERTFLVSTIRKAQFTPPDMLFFMQGSTLMAQRLDLRQRALIGQPMPVVAPVHGYDVNGGASFSVSANGVIVYRLDRPSSTPNYGPINVVVNWLSHREPINAD